MTGEQKEFGDLAHGDLVEYYRQNYPREHVDGLVRLFLRKAPGPRGKVAEAVPVERTSSSYEREDLVRVLKAASVHQIHYVGW